jgi:AraC family transcriptional regulator of adaptative response/methylated-DNA-[protein]-cysteine methyltransferase
MEATADAKGIGFHLAESSLGILGVAATARGVCHICLGDEAGEVEAALRAEFPWADLQAEPERLAPFIDALQRHLRGETRELDLPLDVRGSQFQRRVWSAIAAVPYGCTRAYADLAADIGQPRAARAVAQACGANPVAIAVPCHRIIGRRGELGGYRYGAERKRRLLAQESVAKLASLRGHSDRIRGSGLPGAPGAGGVARPHSP